MRKQKLLYCITFIIFLTSINLAYAFELPKWFPFNRKDSLKEWEEKIFKGKVVYEVEPKREGGYLVAQSKQSCSGLIYKIRFDVRKLPMMSWRWKVIKFPQKEIAPGQEGNWIERDDFAARVYVIFPSWNLFDIQSIEYVWSDDLPEGKIISNPSFSNLKMIVIESGRSFFNQWAFEERNIYEDYKKVFGRPPRRLAGAIAIMTDSDNSVSTAEAFYKDMKVGYKNEKAK